MSHKTGGKAGGQGSARQWMSLLLGLAMIWLFLIVVAPAVVQGTGIGSAGHEIEPGACFHTDVSMAGEAELYVRHALQ